MDDDFIVVVLLFGDNVVLLFCCLFFVLYSIVYMHQIMFWNLTRASKLGGFTKMNLGLGRMLDALMLFTPLISTSRKHSRPDARTS